MATAGSGYGYGSGVGLAGGDAWMQLPVTPSLTHQSSLLPLHHGQVAPSESNTRALLHGRTDSSATVDLAPPGPEVAREQPEGSLHHADMSMCSEPTTAASSVRGEDDLPLPPLVAPAVVAVAPPASPSDRVVALYREHGVPIGRVRWLVPRAPAACLDPEYARVVGKAAAKRLGLRGPPLDTRVVMPDGSTTDVLLFSSAADAIVYSCSERDPAHDMPFACPVPGCGFRGSQRKVLLRHVRIQHTREQPFGCGEPGCRKRFWDRDGWTSHQRTHRTLPAVPCPIPGCDWSCNKPRAVRALALHLQLDIARHPGAVVPAERRWRCGAGCCSSAQYEYFRQRVRERHSRPALRACLSKHGALSNATPRLQQLLKPFVSLYRGTRAGAGAGAVSVSVSVSELELAVLEACSGEQRSSAIAAIEAAVCKADVGRHAGQKRGRRDEADEEDDEDEEEEEEDEEMAEDGDGQRIGGDAKRHRQRR